MVHDEQHSSKHGGLEQALTLPLLYIQRLLSFFPLFLSFWLRKRNSVELSLCVCVCVSCREAPARKDHSETKSKKTLVCLCCCFILLLSFTSITKLICLFPQCFYHVSGT